MKQHHKNIVGFLMLIFSFSINSFGQELNWLQTINKIKPLVDTRTSVRKLLGNPVLVEENRDYFDIKEGRIVAYYSYGECSPMDLYGKWKVSKDTLIAISFSVDEEIIFSKNKFDLKGFKSTTPDDTPQVKIYANKNLGIMYFVLLDKLTDVEIKPSKTQFMSQCE